MRGAHGVFARVRFVHGRAHGAGGVDAGAARLVGEADEVRIGEAVLEHRQVGSLAVGQVQDLFGAVRHHARGQHHQVDATA